MALGAQAKFVVVFAFVEAMLIVDQFPCENLYPSAAFFVCVYVCAFVWENLVHRNDFEVGRARTTTENA